MTHPDVNTNIKAFKKLDFSVVFSYHLDNPTAKYAILSFRKCTGLSRVEISDSEGMRSPDLFSRKPRT